MEIKIMPVTDLRRVTSRILRSVGKTGMSSSSRNTGAQPRYSLITTSTRHCWLNLEDLSDLPAIEEVAGETARSYEEFLAEMGGPDAS